MVWIDALLRSLGMFYAFAGVVAVRAGLQSAFLDVALAVIGGGKPSRRERMQSLWLVGGAILIGWSGLALAILWDGALLLFLANAAVQAAYLGIAAPRYFDLDDPPDPAGRRQTRNAFYVYLAATAFVAAAAYGGRLVGLAEIPAAQSSLAAALALVGVLYALQQGIFPFGRSSREETLASNDTEVADEAIDLRSQRQPGELPGRILIMAEMDGWPTWEVHEISEGFDPAELALSPALAADLADWAEAFNDSFDRDNPGAPRPWTEAQNAEHESRGRDLAIRVKQAMIDRGRGDIDVGYWTDADGTIWLELSDLPPDSGAPNSASAG